MGKWMPMEGYITFGLANGELKVCDARHIDGLPFPDDVALCRLTDAPTLPPDVAATMRDALEFRRDMIHGSDEVNGFTTEGGRTALVRIDAALAWLNAQSPTP